jgi:tRNA (guanine-N7-)-methyltransferase
MFSDNTRHGTHRHPYSFKWFRDKQRQISKAQKRAIRELWPQFGITLEHGVKLDLLNTSHVDFVLDIGFGTGDSLVSNAKMNPDKQYIGCELLRSGIGACIQKVGTYGIKNVKLIRSDVYKLLSEHLPDDCLSEVHVLFPDPFHNEGNSSQSTSKVMNPEVVRELERTMKHGGVLRIATDVPTYARYVQKVLKESTCIWETSTGYPIVHVPLDELMRPVWRPVTKYEADAHSKGHETITNLEFVLRTGDSEAVYI